MLKTKVYQEYARWWEFWLSKLPQNDTSSVSRVKAAAPLKSHSLSIPEDRLRYLRNPARTISLRCPTGAARVPHRRCPNIDCVSCKIRRGPSARYCALRERKAPALMKRVESGVVLYGSAVSIVSLQAAGFRLQESEARLRRWTHYGEATQRLPIRLRGGANDRICVGRHCVSRFSDGLPGRDFR